MSKWHVIRGGSYINDTRFLRPTYRIRFEPEDRYWNNGFRLIIVAKRTEP